MRASVVPCHLPIHNKEYRPAGKIYAEPAQRKKLRGDTMLHS